MLVTISRLKTLGEHQTVLIASFLMLNLPSYYAQLFIINIKIKQITQKFFPYKNLVLHLFYSRMRI